MKIVGYYVTLNAAPCAFRNVGGTYRAGILVSCADPAGRDRKGKPSPAAFFAKPRDARRAIHRSVAAAAELRAKQSLVGEWAQERVPSYFAGALNFEIWPLAKQ